MKSEKKVPARPENTRNEIKKEGVTSAFSAATNKGGKYAGEDLQTDHRATGGDGDKVASSGNDESAGGNAPNK